MAETPIFIAENMGALMTMTCDVAAASGFPETSVLDNLHYTSYKMNAAGTVVKFSFDPVAAVTVDCAVIEPMFTDAAGYFVVRRNGGVILDTNGTISVVPQPTLLKFASGAINVGDDVEVWVVSTSVIQVRHIWVGLQLPVKAPVAPFDPEKVMQPKNQFFARSGVMTKQSPIYTKKLLEMEINNISVTDYTNLLALYNKSFLKGLPFWYFLKPTSQPKMGYLYEWDQDEFDLSYLKDGTHRRCSIRAIADYSPDRTTAAL